jgi:sulfur-oxidizing protein SoxA
MIRVVAALAVALVVALPANAQRDARRSGFDDMSPATQAIQRDDTQNPAMLFVADGGAAWQRPAGAASKACADCHGDARSALRGVAARYPAWDAPLDRPVTLADRINLCRSRHQQAEPWRAESDTLVAMTAFVAMQSRGLPIAPPEDPRLAPFRASGEQRYRERIGQLNLACAQCHDEQASRRLGGTVIPQAHPTGYPIYRLEWQALGSLQRRLRNCYSGVRAEVPPFGAPALVELELFLMHRAAGMAMETPGVRP